ANRKTLGYWHVSGFLSPSLKQSSGPGTRRLYSFSDLVAIRVTRELRRQGLSLQALRKLVKFLRDQKQMEEHPLAGWFVVWRGKDVVVLDGDKPMSALREPGQGVFHFVVDLDRAVEEVREAVRAFPQDEGQKDPGGVKVG